MQSRFAPLTAGILVCMLTTSAVLRADDKKDIQALYLRVAKAMAAKDVNGVTAPNAKDYVYTVNGQSMSGQQILDELHDLFNHSSGPIKCKYTVVSCKVTGKIAAVTSARYTEMLFLDQGKTHKFTSDGKSNDSLVRTPQGWMMKSAHIVSNVMTFDGKPYDPSQYTKPSGK